MDNRRHAKTLISPKTDTFSFVVPGTPAPQGSMKAFVVAGRARITSGNNKTMPWRQAIVATLNEKKCPRFVGPVRLLVVFYFARPRAHYGSGKNADKLKASAPLLMSVKPDLDKLVRSVGDAVTSAGVWDDDARIVGIVAEKRYVDEEKPRPCAWIQIQGASHG